MLRSVVSWRVGLTCMLLATAARAQTAPTSDTASRDVEVELAGADGDIRRLLGVLTELLTRSHARVRWNRVAAIAPADVLSARPDPALRARAWIDVGASTARIYLADAGSQRFLVRNFDLQRGLTEVAREQIAHVVAASIDALLQGDEIGISRAQASAALGVPSATLPSNAAASPPPSAPTASTPPAVAPVATAPPPPVTAHRADAAPRAFRADLDLGYTLTIFAPPSAPVAHGPALSFAARLGTGPFRAIASLGASLALPVSVDADPIGVRLDTVSLRAAGGFAVSPDRDWSIRVLAGVGADILHIEPTTRFGSGAQLAPARYAATPILSLQASVQMRIADRLALFVGAGADIDARGTYYQAMYAGQTVSVLSPWAVRPVFMLGLRTVVIGNDDARDRSRR